MKYNITTNDGELSSITVFHGGNTHVATAEHPAFARIVEAAQNPDTNSDELVDMFDLAVAVGARFQRLSERVTAHAGRIYLDGVEMNNVLTQTIAAYHAEGHDNVAPLVAFMEKIETNPNAHSREHLFRWMEKHHFAICPDGDFIAYKGLAAGDVSVSSGTALVNGVLTSGQIPNKPGTIIEMPRDQVQFDPKVGCSTGLHAGNWRYASTFGSGKTIRVKINPRDVVSVPVDSNDEKLRVCRYKVLDVVAAEDTSVLFVDAALKTLCVRAQEPTAQPMPEKPSKASKSKSPAPKKKAAPAKPKWYEDFRKPDFSERPYKELQWLCKEWEVKVSTNKAKPVLVDALTKAAAARRRARTKLLNQGKRSEKLTKVKK